MTSRPPAPVDESADTPRWGLGDVGLGFVLAEVVSAVVAVAVLSATTYTPDNLPLWLTYVLEIPLWAFLIGVPVWAVTRKGGGVDRDLGLRMRWVDAPIGIAAGLAGQLVLIPIVYWPIFKLIGHSENVSKVAEQLTNKVHGPADVIVIFLLVAVGAPVAEEIFFRGLTQRSLLKLRGDNANTVLGLCARANPWSAVILTAAFFAASHFEPLQFPGLFAFGLVLGVPGLAQRAPRSQHLGPSHLQRGRGGHARVEPAPPGMSAQRRATRNSGEILRAGDRMTTRLGCHHEQAMSETLIDDRAGHDPDDADPTATELRPPPDPTRPRATARARSSGPRDGWRGPGAVSWACPSRAGSPCS